MLHRNISQFNQKRTFQTMKIRMLERGDISALETLRLTAYQHATGTKLDDNSFLLWNELDEQSCILVMENDAGKIISTMRGTVIHQKEDLENFFDIRLHQEFLFPKLAVSRAATFLEYRGRHYTVVLRTVFLQACIRAGIEGIATTIQEDASRVPLFRDMGCQMEIADINHRSDSYFNNSSRVLFGMLKRKDFFSAYKVASERMVSNLSDFTYTPHLVDQLKTRLEYTNRTITDESLLK